MNQKRRKVLDQLFDMAVDHPSPDYASRHAAAILIRDKVISWGFNSAKSHTFCQKFSKNDDAIYWHAETAAIYNAIRRNGEEILEGSTLVVVRAKKDRPGGNWVKGLSAPCKGCMSAIVKYKIKNVIYTTDGEQIATTSFDD